MPPKPERARRIATSLLALTVVSLLASCGWARPKSNAPTIACEQPPASLLPPYPTGENCRGTDAEVRQCVGLEATLWKLAVIGLYAGEVEKRATEDRCLQRHRDAGDIR